MTCQVPLHDVAHARAGDKGDRLSICLFAYDSANYALLCEQVTEDYVKRAFGHRGVTHVARFLLPNLNGMNFVIDGALEGGVNGSLNLDGHGKSQSYRLLEQTVDIPTHAHQSGEKISG